MPYLWVLLDGNEDSLGQLDVFIADDVEVFLHVAIFPQFVTFTLFNFWQDKKKRQKLGVAVFVDTLQFFDLEGDFSNAGEAVSNGTTD